MKLVIINDIHVGAPLEHQGLIRAPSHLAEKHLPNLLEHVMEKHQPDILIHMGDLIRSENREVDLKRYRATFRHFQKVKTEVIHLLGNHELKAMTKLDVEKIWREENYLQKSYGLKELDGVSLIWLGVEANPEKLRTFRLPAEELDWLEKTLEKNCQPALIFLHYAIDDHDPSGTFFYETKDGRDKTPLFLSNHEKIRAVLAKFPLVKGVFQAHLHYFFLKIIGEIPFITCPAVGDNICGPTMEENFPEIFTLVEMLPERLSVKVYSRDFSFAGAEFVLKSERTPE